MSDPCPLTHIALETNIPVDTLAIEHADYIVLDYLERRCLPRNVAREIIAGHHERQRVHAEHLRENRQRSNAIAERERDAAKRRRQAIAQRDERLLAGDSSMSALEVMVGADVEARLNARGRTNELLRQGISHGESYGKEGR